MSLTIVSFIQYFTLHLFRSRTRQKIILLALTGLLISAFSLLFLQGVMGGLQRNLIQDSKRIHGDYYLKFFATPESHYLQQVANLLSNHDLIGIDELEVELLARHQSYLAPVILRGVSLSDQRFENHKLFYEDYNLFGVILGADLARKIRTYNQAEVIFYAPAYTNEMLGDVPRFAVGEVSDLIHSGQIEVDSMMAWSRLAFVQNLIGEEKINGIRIFSRDSQFRFSGEDLKTLMSIPDTQLKSWEDMFPDLYWAFMLENIIMIALFVAMCFLISLTIVSGYSIFFNKIKYELVSFWLHGLSQRNIHKIIFWQLQLLSLLFCAAGLVLAMFVLYLLKIYHPDIMPDVFVERSLPVFYTWKHLLVSFAVPYGIGSIFGVLALRAFLKDHQSFLPLLRKLGQ